MAPLCHRFGSAVFGWVEICPNQQALEVTKFLGCIIFSRISCLVILLDLSLTYF
jgi:hypothetical protein